MSKDDSQLQLKSLEQVLQLGHNIARQDSQERLNEARQSNNSNRKATISPRRNRNQNELDASIDSGNNGYNSAASTEAVRATPAHATAPRSRSIPTSGSANKSFTAIEATPSAGGVAISRLAKVPGQTPDPSVKKIKKVNCIKINH